MINDTAELDLVSTDTDTSCHCITTMSHPTSQQIILSHISHSHTSQQIILSHISHSHTRYINSRQTSQSLTRLILNTSCSAVCLCHVRLCHVRLCHVRLCHVRLCHVRLCHVCEYHHLLWGRSDTVTSQDSCVSVGDISEQQWSNGRDKISGRRRIDMILSQYNTHTSLPCVPWLSTLLPLPSTAQ